MPTTLFKKLTPHCLVLTANSRLTRYLQTAYDEHCQQTEQDNTVFETPRILPLSSWLEQQFYTSNTDGYLLLTDFQEQCLWEEIVLESKLTPELLQPAQMARLAKEAFNYLTLWQVPADALTPYTEQIEVRCLIEWIQTFQTRCRQKNELSPSALAHHLLLRDIKNPLQLPDKIIIIGFDDFNPSTQALLSHFQKRTLIETESLSHPNAKKQRVIQDTTETELMTMARWAKAELEKNPRAHIGCIIPDLGNIRAQVHRIFTETLSIDTILPGIKANKVPFNISAGQPLSHHHMIHIAITVLQFCYKPLPITEIAHVLQSPYLCQNEAEANMGAQIDIALREQNRMTVSITDLFSVIPKLQLIYPESSWLSRWRQLLQLHQDKHTLKKSPSHWAIHFIALLKAMRWPSEHTQTSDEFQLLERFKKACQEFTQLDFIFPVMTEKHALHLFTTLLKQTIFQVKSHHEPIQIMGVLEASGILFDAAWVMGLHSIAWPASSNPQPLIPYEIQQRYQMPHATAKRELQYCEQMTKRLENCAKQVIFSSPAKAGDQLLFPSHLIQAIPITPLSDLALADEKNYAEMIFNAKKTESFEDQTGLPVSNFSSIRGGSTILKLQATCPFLAFASIRLNAKPANTPTIGIPPVTKGTLIHHILFELWGTLIDQETLLSLNDDALTTLINAQIEKTIVSELAAPYLTQHAYFLSVEKKRLHTVIKDWLEFEKTRPPFRVIEREKDYQLSINTLPLQLRLDRVDELSDGSQLLIDYKTGENSIQHWLQERPTQPQLPLYAAFQAEKSPYAGISYGEIRNGQMMLAGVIHEKHLYSEKQLSKLKPIDRTKNELDIFSWDKLLEAWQQSLTVLADEFVAGVSIANPVDKKLCESCAVKSICRHAHLDNDNDTENRETSLYE